MTRPDLVRVRLDNGAEASVGAAFAKSKGLKVLKEPATDASGRALPATYLSDAPPAELKGKALDAALADAGLEKTGTAAEKRERLAAHQTSGGNPPADTTTNPGGQSASDTED